MGARTVSPGGALLRSSRMFSLPKPLERSNTSPKEHQSATATKHFPRHQTITSPASSREKGDWGLKRSLPLKNTMASSTPLLRINRVDSVEKITDYSSAADHSLSLEKFGEMRIAMSIPKPVGKKTPANFIREDSSSPLKSVFEEDMDFTANHGDQANRKRWKFRGPWLANMTEGDFNRYLNKSVRPKRIEFRDLLRKQLAEDMTNDQNKAARELGATPRARVEPQDITPEQFTQYLRSLRNNRPVLYSLVSDFLDLAPLGVPVGIAQSGIFQHQDFRILSSPYGKSGPPPSHPSGGISYLRTNSFMENHSVYGPQKHRSPTLGRIIQPRIGSMAAKIGVGGFVANVPSGDNAFNQRATKGRFVRKALSGIENLDITTFGGAKAYVEPFTATIDPEGKVIVQVHETGEEARVVAQERQGVSTIYTDAPLNRRLPKDQGLQQKNRIDRVAQVVLSEESEYESSSVPEKDIVSSSQSYGLDSSKQK